MMKKPVFWIIAGTTEGRELVGALRRSNAEVYVSVATDYGRELIQAGRNIHIQARRLSPEEMKAFIGEVKPDCVIDTTHPYARVVTDNIREACLETSTDYIRLQRAEDQSYQEKTVSDPKVSDNIISVNSSREAAQILNETTGNIYLTCGSKEIDAFTIVRDYRERVFARVLPMPEVMAKCEMLGFKKSNISYMQGPFSTELNIAMLQAAKADFLVTKDSGIAGGFREKMEAARELGITVILIKRPEPGAVVTNQGEQTDQADNTDKVDIVDPHQTVWSGQCTITAKDELLQKLVTDYSLEWQQEHPWFPLFISLENKKIVIFGGGKIAARRIRTLLQFKASITVIAPEIIPELEADLAINETCSVYRRHYTEGDCQGACLVLAVTSDSHVNRQIAEECTRHGIPISVADAKELCTFYFPAVIRRGNMVIGLTASGEDHRGVRKAADKLRLHVDELLE
ncbi:precorrin-6A reductase [Dehalobacter sp. DCM]|uniref:precorrin-6A reductase n=1 Tax=Dehalobacter sp. DCM TaxID=2907827 RepID=UPI0030818006|nr:precorrin-6A reductase [Dehalobacter sp. DCM]